MGLLLRPVVLSGALACLFSVACGGVEAVPPPSPVATSRVVTAPVAAPTPWPTFTPVPGVGVPAVASRAVFPSVTPLPTPVLYPTVEVAAGPVPKRRVFPTPPALLADETPPATQVFPLSSPSAPVSVDVSVTLEPGGLDGQATVGFDDPPAGGVLLYRGGAWFQRQTLFVMQTEQLPDYLQEGDLSRLPETAEMVVRNAPYLFWFVGFDLSEAEPDFEMAIRMRWVSLGPEGADLEPVELWVEERLLVLSEPYFYHGLGAPMGGVWPLGAYRLELLDDRGELIGSWGFFVI